MKKIAFSFLPLLFVGLIFISWKPQPTAIKEGAITYTVAFDSPDMNPMMKQMLDGSKLIIRFKGQAIRTEFDMAMASTTTVVDNAQNKGIMLMNAMGNNIAVVMNEEDLKQQNRNPEDVNITYLDQTKEIAGYTCQKAVMDVKGQEGQSGQLTLYYTEEIRPENMNTQYTVEGMKGFPLEFEVNMQGTKVLMAAQEVTAGSQDASLFTTAVPEGYREMSMDDLQRMQGGK